MPAARSSATPAPRADATSGDDAASSGLSVRSGGGTPGIPADFQFTYYVDRMLALIESRWYKPPVTGSPRARVRFTIHRSGHVDGIVLEESSGVPSFDRAALRALYGVNPLPPLPPAYGKTTLTVHLTFSE
jgi:TonB family protein